MGQDQPFVCKDKDAHRMCCGGYEEIEQVLYRNATTGKMMRNGKNNGMCSCFLISESTPEMVKEGYTDTPCANCTRWQISHVRQVMMKLKLKTNETKPSEWIIHTPAGRVNPKDGLRLLPPVLVFNQKKNGSNVTVESNSSGNDSTVFL